MSSFIESPDAMPIHRQHLPAAIAAALVLSVSAAGAQDARSDLVPGIRDSIPSWTAEEIAPPYRPAPLRRVAEGPADTGTESRAPAKTAVAPADATEGASGPVAAHGSVDTAKAAIPADEASADGKAPGTPGGPKSAERLDPAPEGTDATLPAEDNVTTGTDMVRVPAPIVKVARRALPGIAFKSVDLSRSGASTVYGLSGTSDSGRAVSVAIDQSGKVMKVDRQARDVEIPEEVMTLAEAVLPGATIDGAMLSLRPAFVAFYAFTGKTASGEAFVLDIRSDGRSLAFIDPE